jgi:hypothetical protein
MSHIWGHSPRPSPTRISSKALIYDRSTADPVPPVIGNHPINDIFKVYLLQTIAAVVSKVAETYGVGLFVHISDDAAVQCSTFLDLLNYGPNRQLISVTDGRVKASFTNDAVANVFAVSFLTGAKHDDDTLGCTSVPKIIATTAPGAANTTVQPPVAIFFALFMGPLHDDRGFAKLHAPGLLHCMKHAANAPILDKSAVGVSKYERLLDNLAPLLEDAAKIGRRNRLCVEVPDEHAA